MSSQGIVAQVDPKLTTDIVDIDVGTFEVAQPHENGSLPHAPTQESDAALGALTDRLRSLHALGLSGAAAMNALRDIAQRTGDLDTFTMALRRVEDLRTALAIPTEEKLQEFLASCGGNSPYWQAQLHTLEAFLRRPKKAWMVDRILGPGDAILLYGESGHGKTHVAIDFAFSCLTGTPFADTFEVARPLTVAYATGEGVSGLADRLRAVSGHYGRTDVPLYIFSDIPQLFERTTPAGADAFIQTWRNMAEAGTVPAQLDVLILDTLHNATAGSDENSARDVSVIMQTLRLLRDALGCAIVLVHHSNKSGTDYRGSSSLKGAMDSMLRAQKTDRTYVLSCEKLKDGEAWPALQFELAQLGEADEGVRVKWVGAAKIGGKTDTHAGKCLSFLRENAGQYFTADDVARGAGLPPANAKNVLADLRQLAQAGTVQRSGGGKKGSPYMFGIDLAAGGK